MTRPFLSLGRRLAFIALAAAGAALALFAYGRIVTADITNGDNLGKYTYTSSDCEEDDQHAEDPINVVFWDDAAAENLDYYFDLYHGWGDNEGETQYFKTWGWCSEMDGQPSSNQVGFSRYHARYQRGLDACGEVDDDPTWGDYSVAAAHYEEWWVFGGCGFPGNHVVPPDGFNRGRDNVIENWVIEPDPGHTLWGYGYWDNILPRTQCNGEAAASNGEVAFIRVWLDSDEDGVADTDDNCPYDYNPGQENADSGPAPSGTGAIGNGKGIAGDDATIANGDSLGDVCDDDLDNDGIANGSDSDPAGDITYDDNNDGIWKGGGDDGPSWDANMNGKRDGVEYTCTTSTADTDGDGLQDRWEACKWGSDPYVRDSDVDGLGDCVEAADVDGNGIVNFVGDVMYYAQAILLPPAEFGQDGDFDIDGNNTLNYVGDVMTEAQFALVEGLCVNPGSID